MTAKLSIFLLLISPLFLFAQLNYKEGYVVTNNRDTLNGFINYKEWYKNPSSIDFKYQLSDSNTLNFTNNDLVLFTVSRYESYRKFTVTISLDQVNFERLTEQIDTARVTKAVFLKEELKGDKVDLYSYKDEIKQRFFILDKRESIPLELLYKKRLKDMQERTDALFKNQLLKLALDNNVFTADLDRIIQRANYSKDDLRRIITEINSKTEDVITKVYDKKKRSAFFIGIGLNSSRLYHTGESLITVDRLNDMGWNKYKSKITTSSYSPNLSAGVNFFINPSIRRLIVRTEIAASNIKSAVTSYYKYNNFGSDEIEYNYTLSSLSISFAPQLIYNFYNTTQFKFYCGAGASFNYLHNNDNTLQKKRSNSINIEQNSKYLPLKQYALRTIVRSGIQINQRLDLSFIWGNPIEYTAYAGGGTASIRGAVLAFSAALTLGKQ